MTSSNLQTIVLFRRALSYVWPFRYLFAIKLGIVLLSLLPVLFLPWPIKIVIDHVIGNIPIGQELHPYPFFVAPFVQALADAPKAEILLSAIAAQFCMLLTFGAFGTQTAERSSVFPEGGTGQDTATRTENQANYAVTLTGGALGLFEYCFTMRLTQRLNHYYRAKLYERMQSLPMRAFDDERIGDAVYRVMYDTPAVTNVCYSLLTTPVSSPVNIALTISVLSMVYGSDSPLVYYALLFLPLTLVATWPFAAWIRQSASASRQAGSTTTTTLEEGIGNMTAVQSLGGQHQQRGRFDRDSRASFAAFRRVQMFVLLAWLTGGVLGGLLVAAGFLYVGDEIIAGRLSVGDVGVLIPYFSSIAWSSSRVGTIWIRIQESSTGLQRVFWLMDLPSETDVQNGKGLPKVRESLRVENVAFAYDVERPILDQVSFEAKVGELTALVGPAGAGKTTLAYLIPRFLTPSAGRVLIDGQDIADCSLASLRSQIAFVFQETTLFDTSIAENLRLGNQAADHATLVRATQAAGIYDFVASLPQGFDTRLGRAGGKLSVGQKQRLSIARALVCNAPIVVVDEPTSALDPETEQKLVATLEALSRERIVIVIAHRLSTIRNAAQILFLQDGRIAERGTHRELMTRAEGPYRHFVELQAGASPT